jgi:O-glycosyl hydrolase
MSKRLVKLSLMFLGVLTAGELMAQNATTIKVEIDGKHPLQTIEGFGASDAWACQFAGTWPDEKRNKMADLLFSKASATNGQPLGIGLNMWRFSIGAGSAEQGTASDIGDEWRRQASFLKLNGEYDENTMPGQVWFLKAAKQRGVNQFLGFVNSPHVLFTLNKKAYSTDGKCNLDFDKLDGFTTDIAKTIKIINSTTGIKLDYISPVNEPQWKWNEHNQEGCPYTNEEIAKLVRNLSKTLTDHKVSAKIQIGEAGQLDYLYSPKDKLKGSQVASFFDSTSPNYVGGLPNIDRSISGHSYFTTSPENRAVEIRESVANEVAKIRGLRYWMSEYCVLGDADLKGEGRDLGMETALFIAKLIHHDLTISNATTWQWWLAVSPGDYKDGLVYIDKDKTDGNVYDSKLLWAFGNYSRFIKAGSRRLPVILTNAGNTPVYVSSYVYDKKLTTIVVNMAKADIKVDIAYNRSNQQGAQAYITSSAYNLFPAAKYNDLHNITIPAQSVTTIVCN